MSQEVKVRTSQWKNVEKLGLAILIVALGVLMWEPKHIGDLFNLMFDKAFPVAITLYVTSRVGAAIIISVMMGRLLERLGLTDALMRIFVPIMKYIGVNAAVGVPSVYNILGDINAAGKISAPILKKAGATKDEQKIAIATMMQNPCSFSILVFGIIVLSGKANVFLVFLLSLFLPIVLVPLLLRLTIWRNTKAVELKDVPFFTPEDKPILTTIYAGAREGAEVLFLLIVPACAVVFAFIGVLDYIGIWVPISGAIKGLLGALNIHPDTGLTSILVGGTLAMVEMMKVVQDVPAPLVVGSFVLAASGWPLQVIFGQIPIIWSGPTDLSERECIFAALIGGAIRLLYAGLLATLYLMFS